MSEPRTSRVTIHPSWLLLKSSKNLTHCSRGISLVCIFYLLRKSVRSPAFRPQASDADPSRDATRLRPKGGTTNCAIHYFRASQPDTLNSSENRLHFEQSDLGHTPVRNAHDQHGTFGSIEHLT